jgi:thymidylate kinase
MKCIELFGMSRAGKTTQMNTLAKSAESQGLQMAAIGRPKIPFSSFPSPAHFHNYYLGYMVRMLEQNADKDFIVLDRGFYDRVVLAGFDQERGLITAEEHAHIRGEIDKHLPRIDTGFLLLLTPEESLRRFDSQRKHGLDFSYLNVGMVNCDEPGNLAILYQKYSALVGNPRLRVIDASRSIGDVTKDIWGGIL